MFDWSGHIYAYKINNLVYIANYKTGWRVQRFDAYLSKDCKGFVFLRQPSSCTERELEDVTFESKEEALKAYQEFDKIEA